MKVLSNKGIDAFSNAALWSMRAWAVQAVADTDNKVVNKTLDGISYQAAKELIAQIEKRVNGWAK